MIRRTGKVPKSSWFSTDSLYQFCRPAFHHLQVALWKSIISTFYFQTNHLKEQTIFTVLLNHFIEHPGIPQECLKNRLGMAQEYDATLSASSPADFGLRNGRVPASS